MSKETITRLNCANCEFGDLSKCVPASKDELNDQGGIKYRSKDDEARAKKVKLITLPGKMKVSTKCWCGHPEVDQWVTEHMWCRMWEAPGTIHIK